jgi:hypothetical protein
MSNTNIESIKSDADEIARSFGALLGGAIPTYSIKERPDGDILMFEFAASNSRFFDLLSTAVQTISSENVFKERVSITTRQKKSSTVLTTPEVELLQSELAASLTVDRHTFGDDFLNRYTPSVTGLESKIVVNANNIVFGRRGSGKSSLLAYAMHQLRLKFLPHCWVAMQTYASREDQQAIASVLSDIFSEISMYSDPATSEGAFKVAAEELAKMGEEEDGAAVRAKLLRMAPRLRKLLSQVAKPNRVLTIFLDDVHVVGFALQPDMLGYLYSLTRGNNVVLKLSGIEQLTNLWDGANGGRGLESPHDITLLKLDHNLTDPEQSKAHIQTIFDRHAKYCGLPNIAYLAEDDYFDRLVLAAAAIPRDAISLFLKSLAKSVAKVQKKISVTSLNAAASAAIEEKLKDMIKDVEQADTAIVGRYLERVKKFCLTEHKKNSFLVKIANGTVGYANIQKLVALRFIHVLHEGITPHKAGVRYVALMLDFGFYIGIRAAKSITLFPERPQVLAAKDVRKLPILDPNHPPV